MSKLSRHLDLALAPRAPGQPLHRWLYAELRRAIVEGRLRPGARLPSSRNLAQQQAVARTTVTALSAFYLERARTDGLLLGFAASKPSAIKAGIERLAQALT